MSSAERPTRRVALIGATGFIGQRIGRSLARRGDDVLAIVRPASRRRALVPAGVRVCEARLDGADPRLADALRGADAIVHAAGTVRGWRLSDFLPGNVHSVAAVAAAMAAAAPRAHLVLLSSLAATKPGLSDYAQSKRMGEQVLEELPAGVTWTILRPTAVYGPGDRELNAAFAMMRRGVLPCLGGPDQRLSFIHVDDLAAAILAALDHPETVARNTYALDDGTVGGYDAAGLRASLRPGKPMLRVRVPVPVLALAGSLSAHASRLIGRPPMLTPGKVRELTQPAWLGDNARFTAATGWRPKHSLATGVEQWLGTAEGG